MDLGVPGPGPRCQASLSGRRGRRGFWLRPGIGLGTWFLQAGTVAGDRTLDGFGEVVPQVPPVGDLDGQRRALGGAFGVTAAAVPADDLHAGVGVQPGAEGFRGPLGQHVDRPAGVDVDQHGAVDMPLAQGKVIHAEHQRSPALRVGCGADQPQQRRPAGRAGQPAGQPGAGPAAQGQADCLQHSLQAAGAPAVAGGQARHLLGERGLYARPIAAEEAAGLQVNEHFLATGRGIGQVPLVAAVHPLRYHAASQAGRLAGAARASTCTDLPAGTTRSMARPAR